MAVTLGAVSSEVNLNSSSPAIPGGKLPVTFQAGPYVPDPNDPSRLVRDVSAYTDAGGGGGGGVGPTMTQLTFGALTTMPFALYGRGDGLQNCFPSVETFSGFKHMKIRLLHKMLSSADGGCLVCISKDGVHSYNLCNQDPSASGFELYYVYGAGINALVTSGPGNILGWNYMEFEISVFGASSNQLYGKLNSYPLPTPGGQNDTNIDLSTGTFNIYIVAPGDDLTNISDVYVETW